MHGPPTAGFARRQRDPRHPGSSRPAVPRLIRWGVDRKSPRFPPCRRRRIPKSHLRGRRRFLPVPPSPACRRRESTHGARPARSSTPGMAARLAASPGAGPVLPRPATIRTNLDHPRCAQLYPWMSLLDFSEWPLPMRLGRSFLGNTTIDALDRRHRVDRRPLGKSPSRPRKSRSGKLHSRNTQPGDKHGAAYAHPSRKSYVGISPVTAS